MAKLRNLAACGCNRLQEASELDEQEARIDTRLLLQAALGDVSHAWLIAHGDDSVQDEVRERFEALLAERIAGRPIAHILGKREFFGREFQVSPATLIPRPDTELLVEAALERMPLNERLQVLDLGTGTGAIAITLGLERPQSEILALDFSEAALAIAEANVQQLQARNVSLQHSHWYQALLASSPAQQFDLIVSNPPYIESADAHLQRGDLRFEPLSALASGIDGLEDIRLIAVGAAAFLKPSGWLLLEHGYQQGPAVQAILEQHGLQQISTLHDLAGHPRVTLGQLSAS